MAKGQRVGYVRVSSVDQSTERQLDGIELDRVFTDKASGKDCGFNRSTQRIDEIVQLVSRNSVFFSGVR